MTRLKDQKFIFLWFILSTALIGVSLTAKPTTATFQAPSASQLYWSDKATNKLQRTTIGSTVVEDLVTNNISGPDGIALDGTTGLLYWVDWDLHKIFRAKLDGTAVQELVSGLAVPEALALDTANNKMYWTDSQNNVIQRANLDGTAVQTIVPNLVDPEGIALDLTARKVYWTDRGSDKIQRADLDGTNLQDVVTDLNEPIAIALDVAGNRLYWTDSGTKLIQRSTLTGANVATVVTGVADLYGLALDVASNQLYWGNGALIQRADLNGNSVETVVTGLGAVRGLALAFAAVPPTPTFTLTPPLTVETPIPATTVPSLPDLLIEAMRIESETNASCGELPTTLGVRLVIRNVGVAAAGAFVITVNSQEQAVPGGLAAGASLTLWVAGTVAGETSATVDGANTVVESNESNNTLTQLLPIPTPVPTCTPVGTRYLYLPAVLQMPTPTPTATVTQPTRQWQRLGAPGQDLSALAISNGWLLATDRSSTRKGLYRASLAQCQAPNFTATFQNIWSIAPVYDVTAVGAQALAGSEEKEVLSSTDSGATWNKTSSSIEEQIAAVALVNGKFYAGSLDDSGKPERTGLFTSVDQGQSWLQIPNSPKALNRMIVDQGTLWIGTEGQCVYQVQVATNSLTARCDGLPIKAAQQVRDIAIDTTTNLLYLATADGVYRGNGSEPWQAFGLQGKSLYSLTVAQQALYAGTATGGVQSRNLATGADWAPIRTFTTGTVRDLLFDPVYCNAVLAAADDSVWILR